ncbi:hypothetical protein LguiA_004613 [Lonicera macranthoides]
MRERELKRAKVERGIVRRLFVEEKRDDGEKERVEKMRRRIETRSLSGREGEDLIWAAQRIDPKLYLSKLTLIEMTSNSFTEFIPNTLGNLRDLRGLYIGGNNLTGEVSTMELRFFNSLTNCKNLEVLEISLYQFNGILPTSIANLSTSFRVFEAFGCQIKGELPIGIGNLSGLTTLLLDRNELTGFIPSTLE